MNDLLDAARRAFENAYAPYSNFKVGAAVRAPSGMVYSGANVENAAYPIGNCAEASAIAAMIAAGEKHITECAIIAEGERLCTPCGGCRQRSQPSSLRRFRRLRRHGHPLCRSR